MARPPKPFTVLTNEKISHRTKAELAQRRKSEESLLSGVKMKEAPEVRNNSDAHKEYMRIKKLLISIEKQDDLYGAVINRYCMITAEIKQLQEDREYYTKMVRELKAGLQEQKEKLENPADYIELLADVGRSLAKITASIMSIDKSIQQKRKMLLDIEKECVMTISAALRTVPKKPEEKKNALLEALNSG